VEAWRAARDMWHLFEPVHAVTYFAEESAQEFAAAGLKGFWMGYFAGRAAPMGAVGPAVVDATFFNFHPARVARALPDAWDLASPARVLDARLSGADRALARVLGADGGGVDLARAATLVRTAVEDLGVAGRPLAAANVALPWPDEPRQALWLGTTVLREHRGDGHVSALVGLGLDGCQALVSMAATGAVPRPVLQAARGWDDDAWAAASDALVERGWLRGDGTPTAAGAAARGQLEDATDRLAAEPWAHLGERATEELRGLLRPLATAVAAAGVVPVPNPIGLPRPR